MTELRVPHITSEVLSAFAQASGDDNPLHRDLDAAHAAGLREIPAHGMLSMAYLARVATAGRPQEDLASLTVRFVATTPLGATPAFRATPVGEERVTLEGRLADGTVTVRGVARYRSPADPLGDGRPCEGQPSRSLADAGQPPESDEGAEGGQVNVGA